MLNSSRNLNKSTIEAKIKEFQQQWINYQRVFAASEARVKQKSSAATLASKLYSKKHNKEFSSLNLSHSEGIRQKGRAHSTSKKQINTSEIPIGESNRSSTAMTGIWMRTSHLPCLAQMNTQLAGEKSQLERLISNLNKVIKRQKKLLHQSEYNYKKDENSMDQERQRFNQVRQKRSNIIEQIEQLLEDNKKSMKQLQKIQMKVEEKQKKIVEVKKAKNKKSKQVKEFKIHQIMEQKQKNDIKMKLTQRQRIMTSSSHLYQNLMGEKSYLLLEVNDVLQAQ